MICKSTLLSLALLTLACCNAQKETKTSTKTSAVTSAKDSPMNKESNIIYFNEGENKFLKEYDMNVTFKGISEDSRCPKGVNCIWAGVAIAQVEVMGVATRPMVLNLATEENEGRKHQRSSSFNGYTVTLAEVTPYPESVNGAKALAGKYRIGITITKENPTTK